MNEVDHEIADIKAVKSPEDHEDHVQGVDQDQERPKDTVLLVGIIKVVDLTIVLDVIEDVVPAQIQIIHPVQIQIEIQVKLELFH